MRRFCGFKGYVRYYLDVDSEQDAIDKAIKLYRLAHRHVVRGIGSELPRPGSVETFKVIEWHSKK